MEPIKLSMQEALENIVDHERITTYENKNGEIFSKMISRADVQVLVLHEQMFYDLNPDRKRFKVFYVNTAGNRIYLETKIEE